LEQIREEGLVFASMTWASTPHCLAQVGEKVDATL
jgi:hypothetical protein